MVTRKTAPKPEFVELSVSVNSLHFDPDNPRRDHMDDEAEIRTALCEDEGVRKLAAHLARFGQNPLHRIALLPHPKLPRHFIVPEGNRRLCAIQLLRDPSRAPTPAARRYFENIKATARPFPDKISGVLFHSEETARVWKSVVHEGEQDGIGTVQWGSREKTRHNQRGPIDGTRPKNPNRQAESLLQYGLAQSLIAPEQAEKIKVTTLTRYLPNVRTALALLNSEDCTTNAELSQFNRGVQIFLMDAIPANKRGTAAPVNSRSDSTARDTYAESLRTSGAAPTDRLAPPYDPAKAPKSSQAAAKKAVAGRSASHPGKRKHLIPSGFVVRHTDPVLLRMVKEGKELDPDEARFSSNYLIRAIVERVVFLYARKQCGGGQGKFNDVLQLVQNHASQQPEPPTKGITGVLKKLGDNKSSYSYELLGNGVHGGHVPSASDNRSNWESVQPSLEYLLSKLK